MRRQILLAALCLMPAVTRAQTYPSTTDPRANLKPGRFDAGEAASGMKLVSATHKPIQFDTARGLTFANSDMAFAGHLVVQGNFAGFTIWDVGNAAKPPVPSVTRCFTSQDDPSIV